MKLKFQSLVNKLPNNVSSKIGRATLHASKHSPAILFGVGVVGVVTSTVLACRATLKMDEVLEKAQKKTEEFEQAKLVQTPDNPYSERDQKRDLVNLRINTAVDIIKLYGPAVIVGFVGITALTGSHVVLTRRNVALTAAYAAVDRGFKEYRARVISEFGDDKDRELRYGLVDKEIVEQTDEGTAVRKVKGLGGKDASVYARFFDESNRNWRREHNYNQMFVQSQQNWANDMLKSRGHVTLNDVYDALGIPRSPEGFIVGWVLGKGGDDFIDFGVFRNDVFMGHMFVNGDERSVLLDFNVDGPIWNLI